MLMNDDGSLGCCLLLDDVGNAKMPGIIPLLVSDLVGLL
jgi:hypothetical protein